MEHLFKLAIHDGESDYIHVHGQAAGDKRHCLENDHRRKRGIRQGQVPVDADMIRQAEKLIDGCE